MIKRQKYIDTFRALLAEEVGHITITGERAIGKSTFLRDLESDGVFGSEKEYQYISLESGVPLQDLSLRNGMSTLIIDTEDEQEEEVWQAFIGGLPDGIRLICTSEKGLEGVHDFHLPSLSFREYTESQGKPIEIQKILSGEVDIDELNHLRDIYIERGAYPHHLTHPDDIVSYFSEKRSIIESELFDKEKLQFLEYTRALAMNVGNPFKTDGLAKLLDISRRKVNKYTELLLQYGIVKAIGPWVQNTVTETSRHVKLYFTDLSYLKALLGDTHYQGTLKAGTIENFVFLELDRKLDVTHTISYYRKKSGAEITFILENQSTGKITPIEVTTRETDTISQAFRTFDLDYHDQVERYMLVNNRLAGKKDLNGTSFMTIPHIAI